MLWIVPSTLSALETDDDIEELFDDDNSDEDTDAFAEEFVYPARQNQSPLGQQYGVAFVHTGFVPVQLIEEDEEEDPPQAIGQIRFGFQQLQPVDGQQRGVSVARHVGGGVLQTSALEDTELLEDERFPAQSFTPSR